MKIKDHWKFRTNSDDKTEYVIDIKNLKQALNYGLILKRVNKVIKFNQKAWLKPYIDMSIKTKNKKIILRKTFSSWWIMQSLDKPWKMWENIEILNLQQEKGEEIIYY